MTVPSISLDRGEGPGDPPLRFDAFISYRHAGPDRAWAKWLHGALETFRVPSKLARERQLPRRLSRVFRDEDELPASADLNLEIEQALKESRFLIVVCSPRTPASRWVNKEVERFCEMGRGANVLTLLIEGEPRISFPSALFEMGRSSTGSEGGRAASEPLASDVRSAGRLGGGRVRRQAKLRILATMLGVRYDDLKQRNRVRRMQRQWAAGFGVLAAVLIVSAAAVTAHRASLARRANDLARRFDAGLDGRDWSSANVQALDAVLAEWSGLSPADARAARARLDSALAANADERMHQPYLQAAQIEQIRSELELLRRRDPSRAATLGDALKARLAAWQPSIDLKPPFADLAGSSLGGRFKANAGGDTMVFSPPGGWRDDRDITPSPIPIGLTGQIIMTLAPSWQSVDGAVGIALGPWGDPSQRQTPAPVLPLHRYLPAAAAPDVSQRQPRGDGFPGYAGRIEPRLATGSSYLQATSLQRAEDEGGSLLISISRGPDRLRSRLVDFKELAGGPLRLTLTRQRDYISFQVDDLPPLELQETFPASQQDSGFLGLVLQKGDEVQSLTVLRRSAPPLPSPLETADARFAAGQYVEALSAYQISASAEQAPAVRQEARFKHALTLAKLSRSTDAVKELEPLLAEQGDRWPAVAGCQLWLLYRQQNRLDDASAVLDLLHTRYTDQQLNALMPQETGAALREAYMASVSRFSLARRPTPEEIARLVEADRQAGIFRSDPEGKLYADFYLSRAYVAAGQFDAALAILDRWLADPDRMRDFDARKLIPDAYCSLMLMRHHPREALDRLDKAHVPDDLPWKNDFINVDRAELYCALERHAEAHAILQGLVTRAASGKTVSNVAVVRAATLLGFDLQQCGDSDGARRAWRQGFDIQEPRMASRQADFADTGIEDVAALAALGCQVDISDRRLQELIDYAVSRKSDEPAMKVLQSGAVQVPAAIVRNMLRDPRGQELLRHWAFGDLPEPQLLRAAIPLALEHYLRHGTLTAPPSADQSTVFASASRQLADLYCDNRLGSAQFIQAALAWKGNTGIFGWKSLARSLGLELRPRLAYIIGLRLRRLGKPDAARDLFEEAKAGAGDDAALARLAKTELAVAAAPASRPASIAP